MAFADNLNKISSAANAPKGFNPSRLDYFFWRFECHCKTAAEQGKTTFQMEYIEEYKDGWDMSIGQTIFIVPKRHGWTSKMGHYRNIEYGATSELESEFPLIEVVNELKMKLHEKGFKNIHVNVIQKPYVFVGKIFNPKVMAKVIQVSVSW